MTAHSNDPRDLEDVVALIALAEQAAGEMARLQAERGRLQDRFEGATKEFNRELGGGNIPVTEFAQLVSLNHALSKVEAELAATLASVAEGLL